MKNCRLGGENENNYPQNRLSVRINGMILKGKLTFLNPDFLVNS